MLSLFKKKKKKKKNIFVILSYLTTQDCSLGFHTSISFVLMDGIRCKTDM